MMIITDNNGTTYKLTEEKCIITSVKVDLSAYDYTLVNYTEIIEWYKLPFYKKWFSKPPVKELISYTKQTTNT